MFKKIGKFLTSDYMLGAGAGFLFAFILLFHDPEQGLWGIAKDFQTLIAGAFAIVAGWFVWLAKQSEIQEERRKEAAFALKFKEMFLSELNVAGHDNKWLLECVKSDREPPMHNLNINLYFEPFKLYMHTDDRYVKYLEDDMIFKLAELEREIARVNKNLAICRAWCEEAPEDKFLKDSDVREKLKAALKNMSEKIESIKAVV